MRRLFSSRYDIAGNSFYRVIKLGMLNKIFPVGNFVRGPLLRPALTLFVLHYLGRPLFWFGIRFEPYIHRIQQKLNSRKN